MNAGGRDWVAWHTEYDTAGSFLARRLEIVQRCVRTALNGCAPGPVCVVSMCAGEARDLLGALDGHLRARDVSARLVELDPTLVSVARARVAALGLPAVEIVEGDAGTTAVYEGAAPADLVLACGVFGNIVDDDIARTIAVLPGFCRPGAIVVWTRHRKEPDKTPWIRSQFAAAGFTELSFDAPSDFVFTVGAARYDGPAVAFPRDERLFTFVGFDQLASS